MTLCTCLECKVFTTFTQKINYYVFSYFFIGRIHPRPDLMHYLDQYGMTRH